MAVTPSISILNVIVAKIENKSMSIPVLLSCKQSGNKNVETKALLDTGAGGKFIDQNFVLRNNLRTRKLAKSITVYNVDGTENKTGMITQYVDVNLQIGNRTTSMKLLVTGLGHQKIIFGFPWFEEQNPEINWETGTLTWQMENKTPATSIEVLDEEEYLNRTQNILDEDEESVISFIDVNGKFELVWINMKTNLAMDMAIKNNLKKQERTVEEMVPKEYHEFLNVFSEEKAARFPKSKEWDHKIDMKVGFELKSFKNYNLTLEEQIELDKFLKENLDKGYIRPSQSPMASQFFFIKKKDGKLQPCQDYQYLNDWTVKNTYLLPLISELMDKLKGAKYFSKMDVQWGYNNIRIRQGDEWKAVFKTNKGLFELTVMFFGMCNSPATFQSMMDMTFEDIIERGCTVIYMDDIMNFSNDLDTLENLDKDVLRRLQENNLYLKPTKCEFKKTKIEYLGMVIEEGKITMDSIKVNVRGHWHR